MSRLPPVTRWTTEVIRERIMTLLEREHSPVTGHCIHERMPSCGKWAFKTQLRWLVDNGLVVRSGGVASAGWAGAVKYEIPANRRYSAFIRRLWRRDDLTRYSPIQYERRGHLERRHG